MVSRLLELGHTVHGTCRDPSRTDTVAHLLSLPGAAERLKLFKADLLSEGRCGREGQRGREDKFRRAGNRIGS